MNNTVFPADLRDDLHRGLVTLDLDADALAPRLLAYLADGPQTVAQLAARRILYPAGFELPYVDSAERRSVAQHLELLVEDGRVRALDEGRYALAG